MNNTYDEFAWLNDEEQTPETPETPRMFWGKMLVALLLIATFLIVTRC